MSTEPIKNIRDILLAELGLKDEQVMLNNQRFAIPPDDRLYLTISLLGSRTFAVRNKFEEDSTTGELHEHQGINRQEMVSLMVFSKSSAARERNWEIAPALSSVRAEQSMAKYSYSIGRLPTTMNDASEKEGTSRLNRYSLTFNVLVKYEKIKPVEFFDEFAGPLLITNP